MAHAEPAPLWTIHSPDAERTAALGRALGVACRGGEVLLLDGPMGAGKTLLTSALAAGMGIREPAVSPTFVIMRPYESPRGLTLFHFDFYRLEGSGDLETIGLEDCFGPRSVIVAEWPGRCRDAFADFTLRLRLEPLETDARAAAEGREPRRITAWRGGLPLPPGFAAAGAPAPGGL